VQRGRMAVAGLTCIRDVRCGEKDGACSCEARTTCRAGRPA
jgi:hypothetical protein